MNKLTLKSSLGLVAVFLLSGQANAQKQYETIQRDFPFQMAAVTVSEPAGNIANKGIAIDVGNDSTVLFDIDLVRVAGGWIGGFITEDGVTFNGKHGDNPRSDGSVVFATPAQPGWADDFGDFSDTRPEPFGPMDKSIAHWKGLHVRGGQVIVEYTVGDHTVLEQPSSLSKNDQLALVRTLSITPSKGRSLTVPFNQVLAQVTDGKAAIINRRTAKITTEDDQVTMIGLIGARKGVSLVANEDKVHLHMAKGTPGRRPVSIVFWKGQPSDAGQFRAFLQEQPTISDLSEMGGDHWPEEIKVAGQLNHNTTPDGAYAVDRIPVPLDNQWNRRVRLGGFDFFGDNTKAAFSTWDGDLWLCSGIDNDLNEVVWKRFGAGLFESLGLKIVNDEIYVSSRVGILKLHDYNQDGCVDFYENFNNDLTSSVGFHEFVFDLHTDQQGNFYYSKAGPVRGGGRGFGSQPNENGKFGHVTAHAGTILKVSPNGKQLEVYATGFRAPNGIGVGPDGQVTAGDNEGTWMPACPIHWVGNGTFHGVEDLAQKDPIPNFSKPLCWLSKGRQFDNSGGSQIWVTSDRWGPYEGELLHLSYGECAMYLVMKEQVGDQMQGGVVRIPVQFASSAMRARFNEGDGQLYVAGLRGWQTKAANLSGFDRVRYTGRQVKSVRGLSVDKDGIHLTFSVPLNSDSATDINNFMAQQWNYERSSQYGSKEYSVYFEDEEGVDDVDIESISISGDKKTITLKIEELEPVDQFFIQFNLDAADGSKLEQKILHTIHKVEN